MRVHFDRSRNRWVVRWYEAGRQRSRRFQNAPAARRFDAERARAGAAARDATTAVVARELMLLRARVEEIERQLPPDARATGAYPYASRDGVRWRTAVTREDGTTTTRRGYRPLAELLIGTGARISEALALTWPDIDLEQGIVRVQRQRARRGDATTQTKGKRSRSILIGPRLRAALSE
jgi:integrase